VFKQKENVAGIDGEGQDETCSDTKYDVFRHKLTHIQDWNANN